MIFEILIFWSKFSWKGIYPCFAKIADFGDFEGVISPVLTIVNIYRPLKIEAMEGPSPLEGFRGQMESLVGSYEHIKIVHFRVLEK